MTRDQLRRILFGLIASVVAIATVACSSSAATDSAASSAAESASRVVATAHGEVTVPAHPKRIVSVHTWTTQPLFDYGITPVAVEKRGPDYVSKRDTQRWEAIPKITDGQEIDFEKIANLKPDLIVGVDVPYLQKAYDKLSAIAPTVFTPFGADKTWQDYPKYTADFVNAEDQYRSRKAAYEQRVATMRAQYRDQLATVSWDVIQGGFTAGYFWVYSTTSPVGTVLSALGAKFATATSDTPAGKNQNISYENTSVLSSATALIYYANSDGTPANGIDGLFAYPGFQALPVVRDKMTVGTPDFLPGSYTDALGMLDDIEGLLKRVH